MDDETKARLRQYAAAKKGRTNLQSLDRTLGLVAMDNVQDRDGELPKVRIEAGGVGYIEGGFGRSFDCTAYRAKKQSMAARCNWVRLRHCADWQVEELAKRWPSRKVAVKLYQGPDNPSRWETVTLHPCDVVIAWLRFLWPDEKEWTERAKKYVVGYTDKYAHDFPGAGAKVKLVSRKLEVLTFPRTPIESVPAIPIEFGLGVIVEITRDGWNATYTHMVKGAWSPTIRNDATGAISRLDPKTDVWEIVE